MNDSTVNEYAEVSATDFKLKLGRMLDDVAHGKPVCITRHGRKTGRLVVIREEDLEALRARAVSPLDDLRDQFDQMLARMQTPEARKAAASVGKASSEDLGQAALKGLTGND